ncbi:MAG: hypothetical protein J4G09_10105 [Proteobacteria bacterium]|nr:hypothetical protein [Pseudomonadota bacterium]
MAVLEGGPLAATGSQRGGPLRLPAGTVLELRGLPGPLARRVYRENLVNPKWTVEIIGSDADQRAGLLAEKKWLEERLAGVEAEIKAMSSRRLRRWPVAQRTLAG